MTQAPDDSPSVRHPDPDTGHEPGDGTAPDALVAPGLGAEPLEGEAGEANALPEETHWICGSLGIPVETWVDVLADSRNLAPYDLPSALLALEETGSRGRAAAFDHGYTTSPRLVEVPVGLDEVRRCLALGTSFGFDLDDGRPVVARIEQEPTQVDSLRLVVLATDAASADEAHRALAELRRGRLSTWRRRALVFDPTPSGVVRPIRPVEPHRPPRPAEQELRRSVLGPLARDGSSSARRTLLLTGPAGSGKSACVRWLGHTLEEQATTLLVPPRAMANPDLLHLAFEMAEDDAPSVVVLDHLDLLLGDRYSMRYPESLAELVTQLDDVTGRVGVFTVATATAAEPLDPVLLARFDRRLALGAAERAERERVVRELTGAFAGGDPHLVESLLKRTQDWNVRQLAELTQLALLADQAGEPLDLLTLAGQVHRPVTMSGAGEETGSYL